MKTGQKYELLIMLPENNPGLNFFGTAGVWINENEQVIKQAIFESTLALEDGESYYFTFTPNRSSLLEDIELFRVLNFASTRKR